MDNSQIILVDECKCEVQWLRWTGREAGLSFRMVRELKCPIDEHRIAALNLAQESI